MDVDIIVIYVICECKKGDAMNKIFRNKLSAHKQEIIFYIVFVTITTLIFAFSPKDSLVNNASMGGLVILGMLFPFLIAIIFVDGQR